MKIKVIGLLLVFLLLFAQGSSAFAMENDGAKNVNEWEVEILPTPVPAHAMIGNEDNVFENIVTRGGDADLFKYRKINVKTNYEWTGYYRVSDNLTTNEKGGSITCTKSVTVNASISGGNPFVNIVASGSASSSVGYTLNVGANKVVYMGYRVYNKIETGTWEKYNYITGIVVQSGNYKAVSPQYGDYSLINY